jgi:microcystin-dependent protein
MSDQYLGEIRMVGFGFAPYGWAQCSGQVMNINSNAALFSLLGTTFGGNGTSTFNLPNLQSRMPVGVGTGTGLPTVNWGDNSGNYQVTVTQQQMPMHTHVATFTPTGGGTSPTVTVQASTTAGSAPAAAGNYLAATAKFTGGGLGVGDMWVNSPAPSTLVNIGGVTATGGTSGGGSVTNALTGGSQPVNIMNPYVGLYFVIALQGIFPTRN